MLFLIISVCSYLFLLLILLLLSRFSCVQFCADRWIDSSPPGSSFPGILWARTLEWVAISFSYLFLPFINQFQFSSVQLLSRVRFIATPWTAAYQAFVSIANSWSLVRLMSIESVMPCNHLILCHSLLLLP